MVIAPIALTLNSFKKTLNICNEKQEYTDMDIQIQPLLSKQLIKREIHFKLDLEKITLV